MSTASPIYEINAEAGKCFRNGFKAFGGDVIPAAYAHAVGPLCINYKNNTMQC
jgi:hypothetical protein